MATTDSKNDVENRIMGMMVGSAVGDAVGVYAEFVSSAEAKQCYPNGFRLDPTGVNQTKYKPDRFRSKFYDSGWTDDTDMALCILLAFLHTGKLEQLEVATRFHHWWEQGLRAVDTMAEGIGRQTKAILKEADYLKDKDGPEECARVYWISKGRGNNDNGAGNGAIMRTHPVGVICANMNLHDTLEHAANVCRTTHVDPRCVISALIGTAISRALVRGELSNMQQLDEIMQVCVEWYSDQRYQEDTKNEFRFNAARKAELSRLVTEETMAGLKLDEDKKGGFTYKTLGAAIYCLRHAMARMSSFSGSEADKEKLRKSIFEELITELTLEGGDADTNAAAAGALLGAYLGYDAIPDYWRDNLWNRGFLIAKTRSLCMAMGVIPGNYNFGSEADTALDGGRPVLDQAAIAKKWADNAKRQNARFTLLQQRWKAKT